VKTAVAAAHLTVPKTPAALTHLVTTPIPVASLVTLPKTARVAPRQPRLAKLVTAAQIAVATGPHVKTRVKAVAENVVADTATTVQPVTTAHHAVISATATTVAHVVNLAMTAQLVVRLVTQIAVTLVHHLTAIVTATVVALAAMTARVASLTPVTIVRVALPAN
jgi:hypothetical protein